MPLQLADRTCVPCQGGTLPIKGNDLQRFLGELDGGWAAISEHHLEKQYSFKSFREALDFTNAVGEIAEEQGHHPELTLNWGKVTLRIWTHKIEGLTESDFILAAKADLKFQQADGVPP